MTRFLVSTDIPANATAWGDALGAVAERRLPIDGVFLDERTLRILTANPDPVEQALQAKSLATDRIEVTDVTLPHDPQILAEFAAELGTAGVHVEGVFGERHDNEVHLHIATEDLEAATAVVERIADRLTAAPRR